MKNALKGIGAILAGFVTVFALSILTDFVLQTIGIFPSQTNPGLYGTWMLLLAFTYRSIFTVAGGYVTAKFAPHPPLRYVLMLGILGTVGGVLGVIAGWNLSAHWYPIALAVTAFPLVWLGGRLKIKKA